MCISKFGDLSTPARSAIVTRIIALKADVLHDAMEGSKLQGRGRLDSSDYMNIARQVTALHATISRHYMTRFLEILKCFTGP